MIRRPGPVANTSGQPVSKNDKLVASMVRPIELRHTLFNRSATILPALELHRVPAL